MPKHDKAYSTWTKRLYARFPLALRASRYAKHWPSEAFGPMIFLDAPRLSRIGERMSLQHLKTRVKDPELPQKLRRTFQFGGKRILISDDYWATFERDNVDLITDGIEEITPAGIRTKDGTLHELDAIIFATRFALGLAFALFLITAPSGRRNLQQAPRRPRSSPTNLNMGDYEDFRR